MEASALTAQTAEETFKVYLHYSYIKFIKLLFVVPSLEISKFFIKFNYYFSFPWDQNLRAAAEL